jgi:hypothetical protein
MRLERSGSSGVTSATAPRLFVFKRERGTPLEAGSQPAIKLASKSSRCTWLSKWVTLNSTTSANQGGIEGNWSGEVQISSGDGEKELIVTSYNAAGRFCLSGVLGMSRLARYRPSQLVAHRVGCRRQKYLTIDTQIRDLLRSIV